MMSDVYDVIIVGGGPMGLSAAYQCLKKKQSILIIEKFSFRNQYGSSPGFSRQFRISYSEKHLCELAYLTSTLWDNLMDEMENTKLLNRTGCLWFGADVDNPSEGNIIQAMKNLDELEEEMGLPCKLYESIPSDQIKERFPFVGNAITGIDNPKALYMKDGGTVNVPEVIKSFRSSLQGNPKITVLEGASVLRIDYSQPGKVIVTTDSSSYEGTKVILTPGAYINEVLGKLHPPFEQRIKFKIYLWMSTYYQIKDGTIDQHPPNTWPIWYFFGPTTEGSKDGNAYYGFPSDSNDEPKKARVCPAFTSNENFDFENVPPGIDDGDRPFDEDAIQFTQRFVEQSMPSLKSAPVENKTTCIAGFAEMADDSVDKSAGFVLDFLPNTDNRIVLTAGGWAMKFVPVIGIILADLAVDGQTTPKYTKLIEPMGIKRALVDIDNKANAVEQARQRIKLTQVQRAALFRTIIG